MSFLRRFLILTHRYLGIPMSVVFVVWFASGIVMMYAGGMPSLSEQWRLERRPAIDLSAVEVTPLEAAERAGLGAQPARAQLLTVLDRPAWRFTARGAPATVFADTGEVLSGLGPDRARAVAAYYTDVPADRYRYLGVVNQPDQWTLTHASELPLHKLRADDGTEAYVSPRTGELVLATTRGTRALAWAGAIPHWFYITPLRVQQPIWYWTVIIAAGIGCVLAVMGLVLAVIQLKPTQPFRLSRSIPYIGWMRWHYITGAVFGVLALTWAFSGMLSLQPFAWNNVQGLSISQDALGGRLNLAAFERPDARDWQRLLDGNLLKEVELGVIQGEPYYVGRHTPAGSAVARIPVQQYRTRPGAAGDRLLVSAATGELRSEPYSVESILARLRAAAPSVPIRDYELLTEYDSYYYARRQAAPLPVLRVRFEDPEQTWYYVDPHMSRIVGRAHRMNRLDRWLYNGLHSLDFAFWYDRRPLWDVGVILLSLGGLATSGIGLYLGVKRVRRWFARVSRRRAMFSYRKVAG